MDSKPLKLSLAIAALAISGVTLTSGAAPLDGPQAGGAAHSIVLPASAVAEPVAAAAPELPGAEKALQVLEPGSYDWHPELAPTGDMLIVVSLPQQQLHVYRNGIRIGRSTLSSGRAGHETPTGVFPILQKQVSHRSTLYNDAPMPYMQRLTWDGIALHAGHLPGYAASHGCIRMPLEFAKLLYGATDHDTVVIVADYESFAADVVSPGPAVSPDMLAAVAIEHERELALQPVKTPDSVTSIAGIGAAQ